MPHRPRPRPVHARPLHPPLAASPYRGPHPLTPLADREPHRWRRGRWLAVAGAAIALALVVPVVSAALGPSSVPIQPLAGAVAGVTSVRSASDPPQAGIVPAADQIHVAARRTVADGPLAMVDGPAPAVASLTGYRWPIEKGRISLPFKAIPGGEWMNNGKLFHDGVDMASFCGAPVAAAHTGVVLAAGRHFDEQIGWLGDLRPYFHILDVRHMWNDLPIAVVIDDGNGYRSMYAHFRDVTVRVGQHVRAGQLIGHEGATGHASGCHVHYGLFSPFEKTTFAVRDDIRRHLHVPRLEIARIDPLAVLPGGDVALRTRSIQKAIAAAATARRPPLEIVPV